MSLLDNNRRKARETGAPVAFEAPRARLDAFPGEGSPEIVITNWSNRRAALPQSSCPLSDCDKVRYRFLFPVRSAPVTRQTSSEWHGRIEVHLMMHFSKHVLIAACLVWFGGCAPQDTLDETARASAAAPGTEQAAGDAEGQYVNKVVCKRITPTGSRTNATKTCATVAEWEELSRESQDATNELSRRTGMSNRMEGN